MIAATPAPRILVVEDERDIALLVKHTLERSGGARVDLVASGDVAIRTATEQPPDLVIPDLNLCKQRVNTWLNRVGHTAENRHSDESIGD